MKNVELTVLPQVHLSPGQLLLTRAPQIVITVLGSCVAVTMFHRESGLAAICHAMLACPQQTEQLSIHDPRRFRYVSHAVPAMVAGYRRAGINLRGVEIKMFGGGNVIGRAILPTSMQSIGGANIDAAREFVEHATMCVAAESTGGFHGRKILFNTSTGEVLLKRLHRAQK